VPGLGEAAGVNGVLVDHDSSFLSAVDADRLFTALPSALEGARRACGVAHEKGGGGGGGGGGAGRAWGVAQEKAGGNRKPK